MEKNNDSPIYTPLNDANTEEVDEKAWVNMNTGMITEPDDYTNFWCNCCNDEVSPISYFEFKEKIAEECGGNKEKYHQILDGSRM